MNRAEKGVLIGTVVVVLLILLLEAIAPREPDWRDSFSAYKREPYGCALVVDRLTDLFPAGVTLVHDPVYLTAQERLKDSTTAPVNHLFIDGDHQLDALDLEHLMRMVERGDQAFIAAKWWWQSRLLDTLGLSVRYESGDFEQVWNEGLGTFERVDTTTFRFTCWPLNQDSAAQFTKPEFEYVIGSYEPQRTQILATDDRDNAVLVRIPHGKGWFYITTAPNAFTNYALLKAGERRFMEGALSLLPKDRPVLWDEFYKVGRRERSTPLRFVLSSPALKRAYWGAIALLMLTIFVHARRRQRAVPEREPLRNTSREFAETIGRLYFFKGDHPDLPKKMCLYIEEEVRQKLYLRRTVWDEETLEHIAQRTGLPLEQWQSAARLLHHYETAAAVSEQQLLQLNKQLARLRASL